MQIRIRINAIIKIEVNGTVWINLFDFYKSFKSSSFLASFIAMKRYDSSSRFQYSLYYPSLTVSRFLKFDFSQLPSEGRIFSRMVHRLWIPLPTVPFPPSSVYHSSSQPFPLSFFSRCRRGVSRLHVQRSTDSSAGVSLKRQENDRG